MESTYAQQLEQISGYIPGEYWDGSSYLIYSTDEFGLAEDWIKRYPEKEWPPAPPSWRDNFKAEDLDRKCSEGNRA